MYPVYHPEVAPVELYPDLWQGPRPPLGPYLSHRGVNILVLCEAGFQPAESSFPGLKVIRFPFYDEPMLPDMNRLKELTQKLAYLVIDGAKVLVVCHMGVNRSGLVATLTRLEITGDSGAQTLQEIDKLKPITLTNSTFRNYIASLPESEGLVDPRAKVVPLP